MELSMRLMAMVLCVGLLLHSPLLADDWPMWRGPNQDGRAFAKDYFGSGPFGLSLVWQKEIGPSYSSLAVSQGRLIVPYADGESDWLAALDTRSGDRMWKHRIGPMYPAHDGGHDGPLSTPAVDGESVYHLGPRGQLMALRIDSGKPIWTVNLKDKYNAAAPFWGFCSSPTLNDTSVFVQVSGDANHGMMAFDKSTGNMQWERRLSSTRYRSPVLGNLEGHSILVSCSDDQACGFNPRTGEKSWSLPFTGTQSMTPLLFNRDNLLLAGDRKVQLVGIRNATVEHHWSTGEFRGSFATPVHHEGFLYGFTHHALTCVNVESGQRVWRSRIPAGGKALILVDGHLVIFTVRGDLIVVKATSDGYAEKARLNLSSADGYGSPIFADEMIFVRDLSGRLFAVRATNDALVAKVTGDADSDFARFVQSLDSANNKSQLIDEYFKSASSFPIVENNRVVHFVYRGTASDVAVLGSMLDYGEEDPMTRVEGTNLFYRTYEIAPGSRWEYGFILDFERRIQDPLNKRTTSFGVRHSELATDGWSEPEWAEDNRHEIQGRLENVSWNGETVDVYLPPGYDQTDQRYPLLLILDGKGWIEEAKIIALFDQLVMDGKRKPMIVAFAQQSGLGGSGTHDYTTQVANELVGVLDERFRTRRDRDSRTILAKRGPAVAAVYTALKYPDVFGHCVAISYGRADTDRQQAIRNLINKFDADKPRFHVSWNRYDARRPLSFDCRAQSREVTEQLTAAGFQVSGGERNDSSNWRSWRIHFGKAIIEERSD